ncbi:MAG: hypothetical protein RLZZ401_1802, partial [Pseudomonadota bacterium]
MHRATEGAPAIEFVGVDKAFGDVGSPSYVLAAR